MKKSLLIGAAFAMLGTSVPTFAAGDAAAGQAKTQVCMACHGPDGNSMVAQFPKLAGQHADYIAKQLADYKSGKRSDPTMMGMAAALSEQDMADLGAYYASQKINPATYDESKLKLGEAVYKGGNLATNVPACQACHAPNGHGNAPANFPSLASQHVDYTVKQLKAFREGARANDNGKMMRNAVLRMTNEEIEAVAHYIASLK